MAYTLEFTSHSRRQWRKLPAVARQQLTSKLEERIANPRVPGDALSGNLAGLYRVKLKAAGIRLVYEIQDEKLVLLVISVGKRENQNVYRDAARYFSG